MTSLFLYIHQVYNVAHSFLISWWKSLRASGCPTAKRGDFSLVVFGIGEATGAELIPMFHLEGRDVRARDRVCIEAGDSDSVRKELRPVIRLVFSQTICGHALNTLRFEQDAEQRLNGTIGAFGWVSAVTI